MPEESVPPIQMGPDHAAVMKEKVRQATVSIEEVAKELLTELRQLSLK